ncbi:hypothetical protein BN109_053 [Yersinia phage phi80-18]|uniref:Uncharacterized protein n=1 Tax=Yersinia phage phi80-18 TaxID=1206559 RepID=A0A1L0B699_9CAUD|nr:hypothetical protein BN109_053 [Yersinia phage phi80-18]SGZ41914.1 hypothetical protein BN109_053 [Yersinia phage phi80-18]
MSTVPAVKTVLLWLVGALSAVLLVGLMLFYRSEAEDAETLSKELTERVVQLEETLDTRIKNEQVNNSIVSDGRKAKATIKEKTDASIKIVEQSGSGVVMADDITKQLQQRSNEVRASSLSDARRAN